MFPKQGKHRNIRIRCQHIKTGLQLTASSDVLMTVSRNLLGDELNLEELQVLEAPFPSPEVDIYLYWHSSNDADKGLNWLKESIAGVTQTSQDF